MSLIHRTPKKTKEEPTVATETAVVPPAEVPMPTPVQGAQPEPVRDFKAEFLARKQRELSAQWDKEFAQEELLRKQREARDAEEVKAKTERAAREKLNAANMEARALNSETETCPVCGTQRVPTIAISHAIYGTDDLCVRKPKAAKASGQITADAWDMLTDDEKEKGYILKFGTMLLNAKVLKENTPEIIPGAPNCYGMKLF